MSVSVLSVTALGVFQIMAFTETKMIKARNELTVRQGEEIALTYIYDDFLDAALVDRRQPARDADGEPGVEEDWDGVVAHAAEPRLGEAVRAGAATCPKYTVLRA